MSDRSSARGAVRAAARIIALASRLAPSWRRDEWRREWLAEVHGHAARLDTGGRLTPSAQRRLVARSAGAVVHLGYLWFRHWSLHMLTRDIRYALRLLIRRPAFSMAAILTLSLGIGATTAIFTAVNGVLLKPLPYPRPGTLVRIAGLDTRKAAPVPGNLSMPDLRDFERQGASFEAIGAYNVGYFTLTSAGDPERVPRALVSSGYFRALGVQPALGRFFTAEEDRPSPPPVTVISYGFWQRRFGGDPGVLGKSLTLSGVSGPIIGVTPRAFAHPDPSVEAAPDVFVLVDPDEKVSARSGRYLRAVGRLKDGVTAERGAADLRAIAARLAADYPAQDAGRTTVVESLSAAVTGGARAPLWLLQLATLAILAIACGNLASLLLGAASGRSNELSIRVALGAARVSLVRQLLIESLVLAGIGGAGGTVVAISTAGWLTRAASHTLLPGQRLAVDINVLAFVLAVSAIVGLAFGVVPALAVSRTASIAAAGRRHTAGRAERRFRSMVVAGEVALTVVLLVSAALLIRSFRALSSTDPGFRTSNVTSFQLAIQAAAYPNGRPSLFYDRLYERVGALPGVTAVGGVNILPLSGNFSCDAVQIEGREVPKGQEPCAEARSASVGYFRVMGIPLRTGRLFTDRDDANAPHVVVINEALAARYFPGENPIGRRIVYAARLQNDPREIVGVVGDVRHFGLDASPGPEFYTPEAQPPSYGLMTIVVAGSGEADALVPMIRDTVKALAPTAPIYNVRTLDELVGNSLAAVRLRMSLLTLFAGLALVLAAVGTYGVVSIAAGDRTREMVLRLALGAPRESVVQLIVTSGLRPVVLGAAAGLGAAMAVSRLLSALLFQIRPFDVPSLVTALLVTIGAGLVAAWIPARRASRVSPAAVLRE